MSVLRHAAINNASDEPQQDDLGVLADAVSDTSEAERSSGLSPGQHDQVDADPPRLFTLTDAISPERLPLAGSQHVGEMGTDSEHFGNAEPADTVFICDVEPSQYDGVSFVQIFSTNGELVKEFSVSSAESLDDIAHGMVELGGAGRSIELQSRDGTLLGRGGAHEDAGQEAMHVVEFLLTCDIKPSQTGDGQDFVQCFSIDGEKVCELYVPSEEPLGPRVAAAVRAQAGPGKKIALVSRDGTLIWKDATYESRCKLHTVAASIHAHPQMVRHRVEQKLEFAAMEMSAAPEIARKVWKEFQDSAFYKDAYRLAELYWSDAEYDDFFQSKKVAERSLSIRERCCPCGGRTVKHTFQELRQNRPPGVTANMWSMAEAAAIASCNTSFRRSILLNKWSNENPVIALEARRFAAERGISQLGASTFVPPRPSNEACEACWKQFIDAQDLSFANELTHKYAQRFKRLLQDLHDDGEGESTESRLDGECRDVPGAVHALQKASKDSKGEVPAAVREYGNLPSLGGPEREMLKGMRVPSKSALKTLFETAIRQTKCDEVAETKKVIAQS